ncbi:flagellar biosynthesis protein FliQ [bacterium]|nr:flagellar biosynthesis protein FliQ [bacterium]
MSQTVFYELCQRALWLAVTVGGPVLIVSLAVGLLVSIFQAVTSINEATLTFIPKILAAVAVLIFAGPWMVQSILDFMAQLLIDLPRFAR